MRQEDYHALLEECNRECLQCQKDYEKKGLTFLPSACKFCSNGRRIHELQLKTSETEREWGSLDWNSSSLKEYYKG